MSSGSPLFDDIEQVLIAEQTLRARTSELARIIERDYAGRDLVVIGVLKGAMMFISDLARQIRLPIELDFMATSSYGASTESSGVVRILKDLDISITGRDVLVVEDIIDSGLTLRFLLDMLARREPASLRVCALLDKGKASEAVRDALDNALIGFTIPDQFVVGYGLDYAQKYRNLPYVGILKPRVYRGEA